MMHNGGNMTGLTRSQKEIQKAARDFAKGEFDHNLTLELEQSCQFPQKIWRKAGDLGFIGIQYPESVSGGDLGVFEAGLIAETFCRIDSTLGIALSLSGLGSEAVHRFADTTLKQKLLPDICEGKRLSGIAFSENPHGVDLSSIDTEAIFKDDTIVINGKKTHVAARGAQGGYLVLCRTRFDGFGEAPVSKSLSMVWVEGNQDGVTFIDSGQKFAVNMMKSCDMIFNDVVVPSSNLVGKKDKGFSQLEIFNNEIKIITAAQAVGIAQGALDRAIGYIKQREQFNRKLAVFQITRHKIAQMVTKIELARLITYKAAHLFDKGKSDTALNAMAKMTAARAAVEIADDAIQLFGGYGYMKESEVERFFRDAKMTELVYGNPAAQMELIADTAIGKVK
jgi:alkylation response protein AidB-like acyl-CoA dehydrogenase